MLTNSSSQRVTPLLYSSSTSLWTLGLCFFITIVLYLSYRHLLVRCVSWSARYRGGGYTILLSVVIFVVLGTLVFDLTFMSAWALTFPSTFLTTTARKETMRWWQATPLLLFANYLVCPPEEEPGDG